MLAAGVLAPAVSLNVVTLLTAAICVGGTFMVITMAGIKEVLRVGGPQASRGIGMMTAAFAVGQIAGPLTVSLLAGSSNAFTVLVKCRLTPRSDLLLPLGSGHFFVRIPTLSWWERSEILRPLNLRSMPRSRVTLF